MTAIFVLARGHGIRWMRRWFREQNALGGVGFDFASKHPVQLDQALPPANFMDERGGQKYTYVVSPGDEKFRRGVLWSVINRSPLPSFINFDGSPRFCLYGSSVHWKHTPLQALNAVERSGVCRGRQSDGSSLSADRGEANNPSTRLSSNEFPRGRKHAIRNRETRSLRELFGGRLAACPGFQAKNGAIEFTVVSLPRNVSPTPILPLGTRSTVLLNLPRNHLPRNETMNDQIRCSSTRRDSRSPAA